MITTVPSLSAGFITMQSSHCNLITILTQALQYFLLVLGEVAADGQTFLKLADYVVLYG